MNGKLVLSPEEKAQILGAIEKPEVKRFDLPMYRWEENGGKKTKRYHSWRETKMTKNKIIFMCQIPNCPEPYCTIDRLPESN